MTNPVAGVTVWQDGTTFVKDQPLGARADVLLIKSGAVIYFKNGISYNLRCNKIIIEDNVFFDGRGQPGENAVQPEPKPPAKGSGTVAQHPQVHAAFVGWIM
jgi:hypothetical protein